MDTLREFLGWGSLIILIVVIALGAVAGTRGKPREGDE